MSRAAQVFIKAFPRSADGRSGLLESTGLVEVGDCLTAINGDAFGGATLHEVMAIIRAAPSPLTLRLARYPPVSPQLPQTPSSPGSLGSGSSLAGSTRSVGVVDITSPHGLAGGDAAEGAEDAELDAVLKSPLLLALGERVAGIQQRNVRLLQAADRIGHAAAAKRAGVEGVASSSAALAMEASTLPDALRTLASAREEASALCETMARLEESLSARERAAVTRRRRFNEGPGPTGAGGALGGAIP